MTDSQNHTNIDHLVAQHAAAPPPADDTNAVSVATTPPPAVTPQHPTSAPSHPEAGPASSMDRPQAPEAQKHEESATEDTDNAPKEASAFEENPELQEVVEQEVKDEEVKEFVEVQKENVQVPAALQKAGMNAVQTTKFPDYRNVKLPIPDEDVVKGLHEPVNSSLRWLATFAQYLLWKAHITLKTVHGHVVRVIRK